MFFHKHCIYNLHYYKFKNVFYCTTLTICFPTNYTNVRFFTSMNTLMSCQVKFLSKFLDAFFTLIWFYTKVYHHVSFKTTFVMKSFWTFVTIKFWLKMNLHVFYQFTKTKICFSTNTTFKIS